MNVKLRVLFWLGIITLFVPYLGVTEGIRRIVTIVIGALIIYLTLRLKKGFKQLRYQAKKAEDQPIVIETKSETSA